MPQFSARLAVPVSAANLFQWHARPGAFQRLTPPWQPVELEHYEGIQTGSRAVIRLGTGAASIRWIAEHRATSDACVGGDGTCEFRDIQIEGPFASWAHSHRMIPDGSDRSILEDSVTYHLPLAPISELVGGWAAERQIERLFAYRHRVTREDLTRHASSNLEPMTVAITGASGVIGSALAAFLLTGGHRVVRLVRSRGEAVALNRSAQERAVYWNVAAGEIDMGALRLAAPDAVVHLAGEPVYGIAYTEAKKRAIWESRTKGTQLLSRALAALDSPPRVFLSASASGIYGDTGSTPVNESDPPGSGFLAEVCKAWEASTAEAEAAGVRVIHPRIGLVLTPAGGLLQKLLLPARVGLAAWPGDGSAFWGWIALDDAIYALHHLLASDLSGPVNISAPTPAPARTVVKAIGRTLNRPAVLGAPASILRRLGGEAADEIMLKSVRMVPKRLRESGFEYAYPTLDGALGHLLGHASAPSPLPALV
ncbi:MAG: TIGR01777 family oxidoreductase [Rubricoccaceae bacterium]